MRSELLVRIFEAFAAAGNTRPRIVRRLYCESFQAGTKAYGYANFAAKNMIERHAIPKCGNCRYGKIQVRTMVMVFEEACKGWAEQTCLPRHMAGWQESQGRHTRCATRGHKKQSGGWDCSRHVSHKKEDNNSHKSRKGKTNPPDDSGACATSSIHGSVHLRLVLRRYEPIRVLPSGLALSCHGHRRNHGLRKGRGRGRVGSRQTMMMTLPHTATTAVATAICRMSVANQMSGKTIPLMNRARRLHPSIRGCYVSGAQRQEQTLCPGLALSCHGHRRNHGLRRGRGRGVRRCSDCMMSPGPCPARVCTAGR